MPLGDFEKSILRLLAVNRNPESYIAGATVFLRREDSLRQSQDIDVFHDTVQSLQQAALQDTAVLEQNVKNQAVTPDPSVPEFSQLRRHYGSVRGAWPAITENPG